MKKSILYSAISTLMLTLHSTTVFTQTHQSAYEIYTEDFESNIGSEWSSSTISTIDETTILGTFNPEQITLTLPHVPRHVEMTLCFDLWVIDSWDGNSLEHGPDVFEVTLSSGKKLLSTTFSNTYDDPLQSYPEAYNEENIAEYTFTTGAKKTGEFNGHFTRFKDAKYEICRTFTNTNHLLKITFASYLTQITSNESFGLDNVSVAVLHSANNENLNVVDQLQCVKNITLSPNPAETDIRLSVAGTCTDLKGNIYDTLGRLMMSEILIDNELVQIDVSRLPEGTYYLYLNNMMETSIHKFLKL